MPPPGSTAPRNVQLFSFFPLEPLVPNGGLKELQHLRNGNAQRGGAVCLCQLQHMRVCNSEAERGTSMHLQYQDRKQPRRVAPP